MTATPRQQSRLSAVLLLLTGIVGLSRAALPQSREFCVPAKCAVELSDVREFPRDASGKHCSCLQCIVNGYSVCVRGGPHECACAHRVPKLCQIVDYSRIEELDENAAAVCYQNAIRSPPAPFVRHDGSNVRVQIGDFWSEDYWLGLTPKNLTLYYQFPVESASRCLEANLEVVANEEGLRCRGSVLVGPEEAIGGVELSREAFLNATEIDFFYRFGVHRERQLIIKDDEAEAELRDTPAEVPSEVVHFDLSSDGLRVMSRRALGSKSELDVSFQYPGVTDLNLMFRMRNAKAALDSKKNNKRILDDEDDDDDDKKKKSKEDDDDDNEDNDDDDDDKDEKSKKNKKGGKSSEKKEKSKEKSKKEEKSDEDEEDEDEDDDDKKDSKGKDDDDDDEKDDDSDDDDSDDEDDDENDGSKEDEDDDDEDDDEHSGFFGFLTRDVSVPVWAIVIVAVLGLSFTVLFLFLILRRHYCRSVTTTRDGRSYVAASKI